MKISKLSFDILNLSLHDSLKQVRQEINDTIKRINLENNIEDIAPFKMDLKETMEYRKKFHENKKWLEYSNNLLKMLGYENLNILDVEYPWWNDITLGLNEELIKESNFRTELSHSYLTQINKKKALNIKPLSVIALTRTSDNYYVMGSKTGAYDGKLTFVPSGSIVLNEIKHVFLADLINHQFEEELNLSLDNEFINYKGLIYDKKFGKNYLIVVETVLPVDSQYIRESWQKSKGNFEFFDMHFLKQDQLKENIDRMLEPAKLCLGYTKELYKNVK